MPGGAGGQHINKTSSAVRITHLPTGIVVQCQNERSQHHEQGQGNADAESQNYSILKEQEQADKVSDIRGEIKEIGFGNQIRSYVMQPYTMVKDHRTRCGEQQRRRQCWTEHLDPFINAYLKQN